jgi:hypothetical protein
MGSPSVHQIRVLRYARDGGYAAIEWLGAFKTVELPPVIADGESFRLGVQITKKRAIDVIIRVEVLDSFADRLKGRLSRSYSDKLYKNKRACCSVIPSSKRPMALLSARFMGKPIRILVCQPLED